MARYEAYDSWVLWGTTTTVSGQRCRVVLSDLCKVSAAVKSEAAAKPNCWRCLNT